MIFPSHVRLLKCFLRKWFLRSGVGCYISFKAGIPEEICPGRTSRHSIGTINATSIYLTIYFNVKGHNVFSQWWLFPSQVKSWQCLFSSTIVPGKCCGLLHQAKSWFTHLYRLHTEYNNVPFMQLHITCNPCK